MHAVLSKLFPGPTTSTSTFTVASSSFLPPRREPLHVGVTAVHVVQAAAADDALAAALRTVNAASWGGPNLDAYFADIAADIVSG